MPIDRQVHRGISSFHPSDSEVSVLYLNSYHSSFNFYPSWAWFGITTRRLIGQLSPQQQNYWLVAGETKLAPSRVADFQMYYPAGGATVMFKRGMTVRFAPDVFIESDTSWLYE